uniref:Uncharacterized protein n=1 Tax=Sphaerodactylus townsendi TaxID=933632 RepID=A0ACB8FNK8_9SAUR
MAAVNHRNGVALKEVWSREENTLCADCEKPNPDWASYTLGVFICLDCSVIHRNILSVSNVKSLRMDHWDEAQVQFLAQHGNAVAKATYEAHIPIYYYHPVHTDCQLLKEQWIQAKYQRKEFMEPGKQPPNSNVIKIDTINATFQPEKIGHPNGLQITYLKDNKTRNIFLYHEDGKEIVDWFNAIRAVLFHYLKVAFPIASDKELKSRLTRNFLKEGYMEKTGPRQKEPFKKRWFTLDHRRLMYFKDSLDAFAKGEVFVGSGENGYSVKQGLPAGAQGSFTWPYVITFVTPDRDYLFTCETERDRQEWIAAFSRVMEQPMTPQEFAIEAYFRLKP